MRAHAPAAGSFRSGSRPKPNKQDLLAAANQTVPDVIAVDLRVLFCGINPGLYSAWAGHHFARPGNRFWPALFAAGFTDRLVQPQEERQLLASGLGITNLVDRATVASGELSTEELRAGGRILKDKARKFRPKVIAILGVTAYRAAFGIHDTVVGPQPLAIYGSLVWVLPNPSGLNAHFTPPALAKVFRALRLHLESRGI